MRRVLWSVIALPTLALLVGCAASPSSTLPDGSASPSEREPSTTGSALIGLWKVSAATERDSTWVAITQREIRVERDRLLIDASWVAGDDRLAAVVTGWDGHLKDRTVPWLENASSFASVSSGVQLRSSDGRVLATLSPASTAPSPRGGLNLMATSSIAPTDAALFAEPTPPPRPGPTVTKQALLGRWRTGQAAQDGTRPTITLSSDGSYIGSDGCNGISGKWLLLPHNRMLFTDSFQSTRACDNLRPVGMWAFNTRTASIADDALTLYDVTGRPLGTFDRN